MTSMDNFNHFETCLVRVPPATRDTATVTSNGVDLDFVNSATMVFLFGPTGDTLSATVKLTCKIQESDDDVTYTDVADAEVIDTSRSPSNSITVDANAETSLAYKLGYKGNARYIRGVVTVTGTHTYGTSIAIIAILGNERMGPGAQASVATG